MGQITIEKPSNERVTITEDGWLRIGIGNFADQTFAARATLAGDANHPVAATVTANVGGTTTPISLAPVTANLNGAVAVNAAIGGNGTAINLAPLRIELGHFQILPNITIEFRLFGKPIGSIRIAGNANVG